MKNIENKSGSILEKPKISFWLIALVILSILFYSGCATIIGLVIGSKTKKYKNSDTSIPGWEIESIQPGQEVEITMNDLTKINGKFFGLYLQPLNNYSKYYNYYLNKLNDSIILPKIEDSIYVNFKYPKSDTLAISGKLKLAGFDYNNLIIIANDEEEIEYIPLSTIENISDEGGNKIQATTMKGLLDSGILPSRRMIRIKDGQQEHKLVPAHVKSINVKTKSGTYAATGAIIGLGLDAILMVIAVNSIKFNFNFSSGNTNTSFSCPFIYSYDGKQYRLDAETFGGSIFSAAQRTDLDNLDYLKEDKGYFKLKLTNELDETQFVDELKLLVLDHPQNTRIIPSFDGNLYTINEWIKPIKAEDWKGNSVLDEVSSNDDKLWTSNPFNRNTDIKSDGRDFLTLEFNKPENALQVKLVFNVLNTMWASSLQKDMLELHGNKLQDWYALMNNSETARSALTQAMIREGMLLVQIWNGSEWETRDFVWEVGPSIPKEQVVLLNLEKIKGQKLKIKLESTVGFWIINSVNVDYTDDIKYELQELSIEKAIDHSGKNVAETLNTKDGLYHEMPSTTDWVEIKIKAIPKMKNKSRSFILKCSGYYTIHANEEGEPQSALLNKLVNEPGAYGQYTLQQLSHFLSECNYADK